MSVHTMQSLFKQLRLDSSESGVKQFIDTHKLSRDQTLEQAEFWTRSLAELVQESWQMDADRVDVIEQLNVALRTYYPQSYR